MIRIRYVHNIALPVNRTIIEQVQMIFRQNFPRLAAYADKIPDLLAHPFEHRYQTILLASQTALGQVTGFSLFLHFPEINFSFLDFLAVRTEGRLHGIGSALYEATREYCQGISSLGLFMEVQPDDPALTTDPAQLAQSSLRLRFYEHYGVRPIIGTAYETPVGEPPTTAYLLFDSMNRTLPLHRAQAQDAVRMILQRRFSHIVDKDYIEHVTQSFVDDPVRFRPPRYVRDSDHPRPVVDHRLEKTFTLVMGHKHLIHHIRSRGYFERPARVGVLREAVSALNLFTIIPPRRYSEKNILAVHDHNFVNFLKVVCTKLQPTVPVYPDTFPIRRPDRRPRLTPVQAGYYCIDASTPLYRDAYLAARDAVDVALTAADEILAGSRVAYALCRPPGHHAERRVYGGFCYFNNVAVAAHHLSRYGKVAILDIDFHHGNGTQDIFYARCDVLTVSIHGHPDHAFPYFSGFADEIGEGPGRGFNFNFPLPANTAEAAYLKAFEKAIKCIKRFRPDFLLVSLGMDIFKGDPTGTFLLTTQTLAAIGKRLAGLDLPLLFVQEGGYNLRNLKRGAVALFLAVARTIDPRPFIVKTTSPDQPG